MAKDETVAGLTGKPVPKPKSAKKQYKLEKERRMQKHLGRNVGGYQYSADVNPYYNPRARTFREFIEIAEAKDCLDEARRKKSTLGRDVANLTLKATKVGAKLAWKGAKAGAKALRNRWQDKPHGSKKRKVADAIDAIHWATLSDAEKRKRRERIHRERNRRHREADREERERTRQERELERFRKKRERERERARRQHQRTRHTTGGYRNAGAGRVERIRECFRNLEENSKAQLKKNLSISEAKEAKPPQEVLNKISKAYSRKHRGVNVSASHRKSGDIRLDDIWIPPSERNKGIGSRAMKGLTKYADKQKKRITLNQAPEPGKKEKLKQFYQKHGFKPNTGRSRDLSVSDTHIRNPQS